MVSPKAQCDYIFEAKQVCIRLALWMEDFHKTLYTESSFWKNGKVQLPFHGMMDSPVTMQIEMVIYFNASWMSTREKALTKRKCCLYLTAKLKLAARTVTCWFISQEFCVESSSHNLEKLVQERNGYMLGHLSKDCTDLKLQRICTQIDWAFCIASKHTETVCIYIVWTFPFQTLEDEERCRNISKKPDENPTETVSPSGHHHHLPPYWHHGHREGNHRHRSPQNNRRHNRIMVHNRDGQEGRKDIVEAAAPQQVVVEVPPQDKRLWRKGNAVWNRQLSWNWQQSTGPTSGSWCCHCRHLLFEDMRSIASWHCRGELPSSCRWYGQLLAETVTESCQWRLPTAAWQSVAGGELDTSDAWQWAGRTRNWAWKTV